ncbi:LysR substrate-binding domain-containing protein [Tatumella citrea]|uniref:LysR family transcriptional regulator n=1 Tax=Tatumella citrea TaxID=53336 RepID=A0A1Y0LM10_TATCI|nr:LysR substrate-binding domain-containing protein [Tatumella citrea]ARU94887.1 LysR family transcriptional regulator [Tatumella citrea]ARU98925.1 LysR family transcriptional regulator [Tatumella citrea]
MKRILPGTPALIAFEASARHGSFSRAATELFISEGAVSRQIARLEAQLGTTLFLRRGNRVELSGQGLRYAAEIREILGRLEQESLRLVAQPEDGRILELAVIPTFANRWLIPRLPDFVQQYPNIIVNLSERTKPFPLAGSGFDAAVHFSHPAWVGHHLRPLFDEYLIPVCRPDGLSSQMLLHKRNTPNAWRDYAQSNPVPLSNTMAGPRFDLYSMLIDAALAGLGIALVPEVYVAAELASGRLHIPWGGRQKGQTLAVITLNDEIADPHCHTLIRWLTEQAALYSAQYLP